MSDDFKPFTREQELAFGRESADKHPAFAKELCALLETFEDLPLVEYDRDKLPTPPDAIRDDVRYQRLIDYLWDQEAPSVEKRSRKVGATTGAPVKVDKRRAFKEHKLKPAGVIPATLSLTFSDEWRQHPGMPDLFIHRSQFAVQQKASRRKGIYWKPVTRHSFQGKDFFIHWKRNKRVKIPVYRAMYECGHWYKKKD
jgi:hypothetical protein